MKPSFEILNTKKIVRPVDSKILTRDQFAQWVHAEELNQELNQTKVQLEIDSEEKTKQAMQQGSEQGFQEGLKKWTSQLAALQKQIDTVRDEVATALVPVTLAAVKRIIGKTLENDPNILIDIIRTSMKSIAQHRKVTLFVNKADLQRIEEQKAQLKKVFDHIDTFSVVPRDDILPGQCTIESEGGILSVNLDQQLQALELALGEFFQKGGLPL